MLHKSIWQQNLFIPQQVSFHLQLLLLCDLKEGLFSQEKSSLYFIKGEKQMRRKSTEMHWSGDRKYPWHINVFSMVFLIFFFFKYFWESLSKGGVTQATVWKIILFFPLGSLVDIDVTNTDKDLPPAAFWRKVIVLPVLFTCKTQTNSGLKSLRGLCSHIYTKNWKYIWLLKVCLVILISL